VFEAGVLGLLDLLQVVILVFDVGLEFAGGVLQLHK